MDNKKIIKIIMGIVLLLIGIGLIYFASTKLGNKNKLITKDTVFLCPGDEYSDGKIVVVKGEEKKKENEVCEGKFAGKYLCENNYCGEPFVGQIGAYYVNYNKGVALIRDANYVEEEVNRPFNITEPTTAFLYDFKNNKKISETYDFYTDLYKDSEKVYFLTIDKNGNSGVMDNEGNLIVENIYKQIGITHYEEGISGYIDNISVAIKNDKFGFLDITTGKEITNFEYDKIGFIKVLEPKDYDPSVISRHDISIINEELKQVYVESNNKGKIINIETGEIVKEFDKAYVSAFPISEDLILVEEENNTVDIIDYNLKSVLKSKLTLDETVVYWLRYDDNMLLYIGEDSGAKYTFDIASRTLEKYE